MSDRPIDLRYFTRQEFGPNPTRGIDWWPCMDPRLLVLLDVFRHQCGAPVSISQHGQALGRRLGRDVKSAHNYDRHGVVLAADTFPDMMDSPDDALEIIDLAEYVGFTGIGIYPHWSRPGLHLDTRRDREPGSPAKWGAISVDGSQEYVSVSAALDAWYDND